MSSQLPATDLVEALMKDPVKKAMLLQLLAQDKDNFDVLKRQGLKTNTTPLKKQVKRLHCESPTAMQRRRALEQQKNQESESSSSDLSEVSNEAIKGPKLPFDELLKGVRAYVEVRRDNVDRSEGIKAVMRLMGATIKDKFSNDVTHVIFKDGSFTTYEKAKLMKIHLVSVLWLDAVRRYNVRVPEKNYPAFGNRVCDENVSILCSQLQKDYEDVIKEEKRRTISSLPRQSKVSDKNRRRTIMTPQTSMTSYVTAQTLHFSDVDEEVAAISQRKPNSPELTSDDSDCGVIDGHTIKRPKDVLTVDSVLTDETQSTRILTDLIESNKKRSSEIAPKTQHLSNSLDSSGSTSLLTRGVTSKKNKRMTNHVTADMELTPIRTSPEKSKKVLKESSLQSSIMSSLRMSSESEKTKSDLATSGRSKSKNSLTGGKENSVTTTMSSLRLSESPNRNSKKKTESLQKENEKATNTPKKNRRSVQRKGHQIDSTSSSLSDLEGSDHKKTKKAEEKHRSPSMSLRKTKKAGVTETFDSESEDEKKKESSENLRRSRRNSSVSSVSKTESGKTVLAKPVSDSKVSTRNRRRATSVVPLPSKQSVEIAKSVSDSNFDRRNSRRAASVVPSPRTESVEDVKRAETKLKGTDRSQRVRRSVSVVLSRMDDKPLETSKETQTPSPPKKSRAEKPKSTTKKKRKLYNPNEIGCMLSPEELEKERLEHLKQKAQKSPDEVFVNPNDLMITPFKKNKKKDSSLEMSELSSDDSDSQMTKTKKKQKSDDESGKKKKNKAKSPRRDSSSDEQRELLQMLNGSVQIRRSSTRLSFSQKKPKYKFTSSFSESQSTSSLPISPMHRRSTMDFLPMTSTQKKKLKLDSQRSSSIVCTKMHRPEVLNFEKIVTNLGRFFVEDHVTMRTTHLVAGESKRTINMLKAIARGCWILKHEWLLKSEEEGKWLNEEDYELTDFSPAVQQCRLQREAFGSSYSLDIFKNCGYIYVSTNANPKQSDLRELISICKGHLTKVVEKASIVVGEYIDDEKVDCVSEMWVLDSIHFNKLKSFRNYLLTPAASQQSPIY